MFTIGVLIRKTVSYPLNREHQPQRTLPFDINQNRPGIRRYYSSIDFFKIIAEDAFQMTKRWGADFVKRKKYVLTSIGLCATGYLIYNYKERKNQHLIFEEKIEQPETTRVRNPIINDDASYSILAPIHKLGFFFASILSFVRNSRQKYIDLMKSDADYNSPITGIEYNAIINKDTDILGKNFTEKWTYNALIPPSAFKKHLTVMIEVDLLFDVVPDREGYYLRKRPYSDLLINTLGNYAEIILASSFHSKEAAKYYFKLFDPDNITSYYFTKEDMRIWKGRFVKPMEEVHSGRKPDRLVLLDNNKRQCGPMCENVLQLKSWNGNVKDSSLKDVIPLLLYLSSLVQNGGDVRDITRQFVDVKDAAVKVKEIMRHGKDDIIIEESIPKKLELLDSITEEKGFNN